MVNVQEETKVMSKEEAIEEVKRIFKGNNHFIDYCKVMIAATDNFIGIESFEIQKDDWNWEKYLSLTIQFGYYVDNGIGELVYRDFGLKRITYRKGNKKYSPEKTKIGNKTSNIHDFSIVTFKNGKSEKHRWDA